MKSLKLLGSCMLAVFALTAMFAASAEAKEIPKGPIKYTDAGEGGAELGTNTANIKCASHGATGVVSSPSGGNVVSLYKGCEVAGKGIACENVGPKEIQTFELVNALGWINKAKNEIGADFKPASGELLAEFTCSGLTKVKVFGSVIGKITSKLNEMAETMHVSFVGEGDKNVPAKFEGEAEDVLLSEFPELAPGTKTNSEQKQQDNTQNTPTVECKHVGEPKEKCKNDPAEISTLEVQCKTEEIEGKKGKETVTTCATVQRAEPEYGRCEKKKEGLYKDKNCSEAGEVKKGKKKGKYEFEAV